MPDLIAVLLPLLMTQFSSQLGTQASTAPPVVMEFYRDYLKPDAEEQYLRIETEVAQKYGAMHPYVTLKSLSGSPEVWFLNGFGPEADVGKGSTSIASCGQNGTCLPARTTFTPAL